MSQARVIVGDCREVLATLDAESVDAIVCDPPYGLEFMGKGWDAPWKAGFSEVSFRPGFAAPNFHSSRNPVCQVCRKHKRGSKRCVCAEPKFDETPVTSSRLFQSWAEEWATAALRVAKPGAHLVAFGGARTYHRLTCAIEDAGWEIRDCLSWLYGQGFPKSLDVSKAIDKAAGAENVVGTKPDRWTGKGGSLNFATDRPQAECKVTDPATEAAKQWSGWGTALKPAWEPIILARKPLSGTVAANVLAHGTGALNVDGCRIAGAKPDTTRGAGGQNGRYGPIGAQGRVVDDGAGRWPANVVLDEQAAEILDGQSGEMVSGVFTGRRNSPKTNSVYGKFALHDEAPATYGDKGGASRFFYTAKASSAERHAAGKNVHPTVKPVDLMRWLCRLVTPPGGLILDPFTGSGSTGVAALAEGFRFVGVELSAEYADIARRRILGPLFAEARP